MKILQFFVMVGMFVFAVFSFASPTEAAIRVKGYYKPSTGTYVMPSIRTSPNKSKFDNYSTKGNYNPYTGKKGTVGPFRPVYRR